VTSGPGVSGVCVYAYGITTGFVSQAVTDAAGDYSIAGLEPDSYVVEFDPTCGETTVSPLAIQYYVDAPNYETASITPADQVSVDSSDVPNVDAALVAGASISGTVENTSSAPVSGVCVYVYSTLSTQIPFQDEEYAVTDANGSYDLTNLPAGTYTVQFDPSCNDNITDSPYAEQFWPGVNDPVDATDVTLAEGGTQPGTDAQLVAASSITGQVSLAASSDPEAVCVDAYAASDGLLIGESFTDTSGQFTITNLAADSYELEFDPTCDAFFPSDYDPIWYANADSVASATAVAVPLGQIVPVGTQALPLAFPVSVSGPTVVDGTVGSVYAGTATATGGTGPYFWAAVGLPPGLSLDTSSGVIGGTPTTSGSYTVTVAAADSAAQQVEASTTFVMTIGSAPQPASSSGSSTSAPSATTPTTTTSAPASSTSTPASTTPTTTTLTTTLPPVAKLGFAGTRFVVRRSALEVSLTCALAHCSGSALLTESVTVKVHHGKKVSTVKRTETLGSGSFALAPGGKLTTLVRLNAAGRQALVAAKGHALHLQLKLRDGHQVLTRSVVVS